MAVTDQWVTRVVQLTATHVLDWFAQSCREHNDVLGFDLLYKVVQHPRHPTSLNIAWPLAAFDCVASDPGAGPGSGPRDVSVHVHTDSARRVML